jgi:hypothetical protein
MRKTKSQNISADTGCLAPHTHSNITDRKSYLSLYFFFSCTPDHKHYRPNDPDQTQQYNNAPNSSDTTNLNSPSHHTILRSLEASLHPRIPSTPHSTLPKAKQAQNPPSTTSSANTLTPTGTRHPVGTKTGVVESVRLVRRADIAMCTWYLTLSHCWGDLGFTTLAKETLQDFQSAIHHSKLTKTFRDALQTTVWLGYEYIWIDALCILQDSDGDWQAETASRGSIYRNSKCTIAALGGRNVKDGLFFHRSSRAVTQCPLSQYGSHGMYAASGASVDSARTVSVRADYPV